jgi:nitrite reductase/ring-hydroxylating ferredoxin subunit
MADYFEAALLEELCPGRGTIVTIAGKGTVYAMDDSCLHNGASLGRSNLDDKIVTSRGHGWKYRKTTGATFQAPDYGVNTYNAKVADGKIWVAIT